MNLLILLAQADAPVGSWQRFVDGALPLGVFIVALVVLLWSRAKSPTSKLYREEKERHLRHMQKVEELLQRIADSLDRNGPRSN